MDDKIYRDAGNGHFVSKEEANTCPAETVSESVHCVNRDSDAFNDDTSLGIDIDDAIIVPSQSDLAAVAMTTRIGGQFKDKDAMHNSKWAADRAFSLIAKTPGYRIVRDPKDGSGQHMRPGHDRMIDFLNDLLAIDTPALQSLLAARVQVGKALAEHPTVQCGSQMLTKLEEGRIEVGVLGLLNGFYGIITEGKPKGYGPITAVYDEGRLVRFVDTREFWAERDAIPVGNNKS